MTDLRRVHSPPFSRSIPTVLRPDQKQKETARVLRVLKIKELLAQFLNRGGCASIRSPRSSAAQTGWLVKKVASPPYMLAQRSLFCLKLLTIISASPYRARASRLFAPLRNGIFLFMAQPPSLKTEGNGPVSQPIPLRPASQPVEHRLQDPCPQLDPLVSGERPECLGNVRQFFEGIGHGLNHAAAPVCAVDQNEAVANPPDRI
jgi:hypothetical protein